MAQIRDKHLRSETLQAYVDAALSPADRERVAQHLGRCRRCAGTAAVLATRRRFVSSRLQILGTVSDDDARVDASASAIEPVMAVQRDEQRPISPALARLRLAAYEESRYKEAKMPWQTGRASRRVSPGWVAIAVVLVLVGSLALSPVRALAGRFLGLFRVQRIEVVEFSPAALFGEEGPDVAMRSLEKLMDEQVSIAVAGEPQAVDETTLRSLSAFRVRLPAALSGEPHYTLQPGAEIAVNVDLSRIRALLDELGYADVTLPDSLDGAEVGVSLAPSAVAAYGDCERDPEMGSGAERPGDSDGDCTVLMQMLSPAVSAPDGLEVDKLGQAYLQLLGMSPEEAAGFSRQVDWTATLVIPLPRSEVAYEELTVDGVTGVLVRPTHNRLPSDEYLLMWVNEGIVYALTGAGPTMEALQVANSLQ
ncbi:MAG: zf-HC2 domain-containing protein [Anaerolineae bacterium]|nr:zf-HC2 domain-containing protein [Anaerolineae bacterium]